MVTVMLLYCIKVVLAVIQMADIYQDFLQTAFQLFFKPCMSLQQHFLEAWCKLIFKASFLFRVYELFFNEEQRANYVPDIRATSVIPV